MKYYTVCSVTFSEEVPEEDTYYGEELYTFIVDAESEEEGKMEAARIGMETFEADLGADGLDDINLTIEEFYETAEDARSS